MSDPTISPPDATLVASPLTAIGPIFIGNILNWLLMGVLALQVYTYSVNFPKDQAYIKIMVYSLLVLDLLQTAFGTHEAWWYMIENWGNVSSLQFAPWTAATIAITCGLISAPVQIFYASRIWRLKRTAVMRTLAIVIILLGLAQSITGIVGSALVQSELSQENLKRYRPLFVFWLAGAFATDVLITVGMIWILQSSKSSEHTSGTQNMLNRLILNTIQTGAATVLAAGVDLYLFTHFTKTNYYFSLAYLLGKLYTNSFMVTLNLRTPRLPTEHPDSIGLRIRVSRQIERNKTLSNWERVGWNSDTREHETDLHSASFEQTIDLDTHDKATREGVDVNSA